MRRHSQRSFTNRGFDRRRTIILMATTVTTQSLVKINAIAGTLLARIFRTTTKSTGPPGLDTKL